MTNTERNEIIEQARQNYEAELVEFTVYPDAASLFDNEQQHLDIEDGLTNEELREDLLQEDNVFLINGKWIYASEWNDSAWE